MMHNPLEWLFISFRSRDCNHLIVIAVRITYASVFVRAEENCEHIFRPNQEMEVTVVVNVGEDAAVGDINGIGLLSLASNYV